LHGNEIRAILATLHDENIKNVPIICTILCWFLSDRVASAFGRAFYLPTPIKMSETELNTGKLIPVHLLESETPEQCAERILGGEKDEWNNTFLESLLENNYRDYVFHNGILYRCEAESNSDSGDIFEATRNGDGTIDFILQYYNGGCSFTEAMGYALKKINPPA
jgi:hypothetical protein